MNRQIVLELLFYKQITRKILKKIWERFGLKKYWLIPGTSHAIRFYITDACVFDLDDAYASDFAAKGNQNSSETDLKVKKQVQVYIKENKDLIDKN